MFLPVGKYLAVYLKSKRNSLFVSSPLIKLCDSLLKNVVDTTNSAGIHTVL